jgi:hypothetical protein
VGPLAPVLPQLPQVSQVRVSSTLSRTVVPLGGAGVGVGAAPGAGLGEGPDELADVGVLAPALPPQEVMVNVKKRVRTETAKIRIRNSPLQGKNWSGKLVRSL